MKTQPVNGADDAAGRLNTEALAAVKPVVLPVAGVTRVIGVKARHPS